MGWFHDPIMGSPPSLKTYDPMASAQRCRAFRRRILDISQTLPAMHIAPAFSCLEIVETIYFSLMRRCTDGALWDDSFVLSKGHGCMAQYLCLEALGILPPGELERFCRAGGRLGNHPDLGIPGIEASTGSLGHGLLLGVGMAYADKLRGADRTVYVVMSDGELQEGSMWEAILLAPSLKVNSLVGVVDLNDFQSLGRMSELHPNFYPVVSKLEAFGWEVRQADGHDGQSIHEAIVGRRGDRPFMLVARTTKGKGVSFMESVAIWHYRSPTPEEYRRALQELEEPGA